MQKFEFEFSVLPIKRVILEPFNQNIELNIHTDVLIWLNNSNIAQKGRIPDWKKFKQNFEKFPMIMSTA